MTKLLLEGALEAFDRHGGDRDSVDVSAGLHKAVCQAFACNDCKPYDVHQASDCVA